MSCRCLDDGILQSVLAIPHHKPGAVFESTGNLTYALVLLLLQLIFDRRRFCNLQISSGSMGWGSRRCRSSFVVSYYSGAASCFFL